MCKKIVILIYVPRETSSWGSGEMSSWGSIIIREYASWKNVIMGKLSPRRIVSQICSFQNSTFDSFIGGPHILLTQGFLFRNLNKSTFPLKGSTNPCHLRKNHFMETPQGNNICHKLPLGSLPYPWNIHREVNHELHLMVLVSTSTSSTMKTFGFHSSKSCLSMSFNVVNHVWRFMFLFQVDIIQAIGIPFCHSSITISVYNKNCEKQIVSYLDVLWKHCMFEAERTS